MPTTVPPASAANRPGVRLTLRAGKEKSLRLRHPWLFAGAIARIDGEAVPGGPADLLDAGGRFLARGYYHPGSPLAARVWTWQDEPVDAAFFQRRLAAAAARRRLAGLGFVADPAPGAGTDCCRLVNAEADGLPGVTVDAYGAFLVLQLSTCGAAACLPLLLPALVETFRPRGVFGRTDAEAVAREGLEPLEGVLWGEAPPEPLLVRENGLVFAVSLAGGQKTGFFLDQRDSRRRVARTLAALAATLGRPPVLLNAFAYTGGFAVHAAAVCPGLEIVNLDSSPEALALAERNLALNPAAAAQAKLETVAGDAFVLLRRFRDANRSFDAVILDPPKFAHARAQVPGACRGYKDINLLACKLLRPGGLLATFSCSGLVAPELFQKVVFDAALDAGREARILTRLGPAADHPVLLSFPEGDYLKGLLLTVE